MKTALLLGLLALPLVTLDAQEGVPPSVKLWYRDIVGLYQVLYDDLERAADGPAVVEALKKALAREADKSLVYRYRLFSLRYPHFFRSSQEEETGWVPPPDWEKLVEEFAVVFLKAGPAMAKAEAWGRTDPEVKPVFAEFAATMDPIFARYE